MATTSKTPAGTVAQCPAAQQPCCFKTVTLACSHTKASSELGASVRKYKLVLPLRPGDKNPPQLHVLAGHTHGDIITITVSGGSCKKGKSKWPGVMATPEAGGTEVVGTKELKLDARCTAISLQDDWPTYLWPLESPPNVYYIHPLACAGANRASALVKVFPNIKWEIEIMVNFGGSEKAKSIQDRTYSVGVKQASKGYSGAVKVTYDKTTIDIGPQFEKYAKATLKLLDTIKQFSGTLGPILTKMGNVEIAVEYPKIGLTYTYQTLELEDNYGLDCSYAVTFKADPLFRVKAKTDILNWVLTVATGPLQTVLRKIKDKLASGVGSEGKVQAKAKLAIELTVSGGISGELKWEKRKGQAFKDASKEGFIDVSIPLTIEGIAEATLDVFILSAGAGVKAGAKTAIGAKLLAKQDDEGKHGVYAQGQFRWEGIKVYYAAYTKGGIKFDEPPEEEHDVPRGTVTTQAGKGSNLEGKKESSDECTLVEPHFWPQEPGKHYLFGEP